MTAAERFAQFALELDLDAVPDDVVEAAKLHVLDVIGCGLAAHGLGIATEGRTTMSELGGTAEASVIGLDTRLPVPNAAFANAMLCHGLDFDDTHSDSVAHVSTVVVPAATALAEARGASGRDLLTAIIAGNETVTRIGMATPGAFHKRGFHPTAICGIFGAAAAAARLGGLEPGCGDERARHRRQHGVGTVRLPRRRNRDEADPPRVGGARSADLGAARGARRGGPPGRTGRALRRLPRLRRHADRPRAPARRSRDALGDAPDRLQGLPGVPLHPRLARRDGNAVRRPRPGRDRGHPGDDSRGRGLARAGAGRPQGRAADRLRGKVLAPVLHRGDARARPRRADDLHAGRAERPAGARVGAEGALRDEGVRVLPRGLPGRRADPPPGRADRRGRFPVPARGAREPDERRPGSGEVPRERRPRRRVVRRPGGGDPHARGPGRPARRPLSLAGNPVAA